MVDQEARRKYAELVRQFVSGRMTEDEYEERYSAIRFNEKELALSKIWGVFEEVYDDAPLDRLTKKWWIDNFGPRRVAQAILFLHSDQEYQWREDFWDGSVFLVTAFLIILLFALFPETAWIIRLGIASILVFGWLKYESWQARRHEKVGDPEAWPFLHQADLDEAKRHPKLLNGKHTMP